MDQFIQSISGDFDDCEQNHKYLRATDRVTAEIMIMAAIQNVAGGPMAEKLVNSYHLNRKKMAATLSQITNMCHKNIGAMFSDPEKFHADICQKHHIGRFFDNLTLDFADSGSVYELKCESQIGRYVRLKNCPKKFTECGSLNKAMELGYGAILVHCHTSKGDIRIIDYNTASRYPSVNDYIDVMLKKPTHQIPQALSQFCMEFIK